MKIHTLITRILLISLVFTFSACHNWFNDDDDEPQLNYLVNFSVERSYIPAMVTPVFDLIIEDYPGISVIKDRVKYGIIVFRITYKTTFNGEPIIASGLVSVPMGEGPYPLMSYQNGTNTLHSDAPSENPDRNLYVMLEAVSSTGFVISIPDYIGFGSTDDKFHPYLHAESTVPVVIDMLRAVKELASIRDFKLNDDLYLTGYSLGGWATMQVQKEIEQELSGEFDLKASAPSAGPYDLSYINNHVMSQATYSNPYYMGFVYNSYKNLGIIHTPLDEIFNPPYDSLVSVLFDGTLSGEAINSKLTTDVPALYTENFISNFTTDTTYSSLIKALEDNSVEPWKVTTPTKLIHGTADESVPYQVTEVMHQKLLNAGSGSGTVEIVPIPGKDHVGGIVPAGLFSIEWFLEISEE